MENTNRAIVNVGEIDKEQTRAIQANNEKVSQAEKNIVAKVDATRDEIVSTLESAINNAIAPIVPELDGKLTAIENGLDVFAA